MNEKNNSAAESYFYFMCHLHKTALNFAEHLQFDKKHPWHLHLVSLYGSIIELTGSACILVQETVGIGVPILLRSAVEAHLDFTNLAANRRYGYHLRASELKEWVKLLRESKDGINPFLKEIADFPNTNEILNKWEKELEKLKGKNYKPLSVFDKFNRANLEPVYRSVYNILCGHSHNNIRELISRHVNISEEMNDFNVEFYAPINFDRLLPYIDNFCSIIVSATETIHQILKTDCIKEIEKLKTEFQKQRNASMTGQGNEE